MRLNFADENEEPTPPDVADFHGAKFDLPSSRDARKLYTVTLGAEGRNHCTCPGFQYRAKCKHIAIAYTELNKDNLGT